MFGSAPFGSTPFGGIFGTSGGSGGPGVESIGVVGYILGERVVDADAFSSATLSDVLTALRVVDGDALSLGVMSDTYGATRIVLATVFSSVGVEDSGAGPALAAAWALNTKTNTTTRYEQFDFNSYATIGGKQYGVRDDGLYELTGPTDAGLPVNARVNFGRNNFGTSRLKSLTQAYVGVASNNKVVVKVVADGQEFFFQARDADPELTTQRVDFARGFRANYFELEILNAPGDVFDLSSIEFTPIPLSRRV